MSSIDALISARGLRKQYGALVVLDGVDFEVRRGDAIGIVGPNGAGKTTLLSVLSGSQAATAGTIGFKGNDVSSLDAATRCRMGIVRTHQVPQPFSGMTVFENVFTAATHGGGFRRTEAYDRCIDAIELCGMTKVANRRAATLGLLDRKRLELTRALATNPQVLLLDEIGGGLTDGEAAELVRTIKVLHSRDIAIVWIEHIVHVLLQVAKRLVCMDSGRVIAEGDPQEVLSNATVVDAYLGGGR
ncbi:MAG: ABC transporter ATP-binding protein [Rhodoferax sp.]|uniref:ABC transporter ATP-binding protein n=1 Tax=Rhodoferax sp. TaxID=50421 RepID=UPI002717451C|nr:ABC transporter ATP-binding protein [Rhodoferax sp.]MDO8449869.1 ABC transporter ATP-binding protein [Rhodoferax sp.]